MIIRVEKTNRYTVLSNMAANDSRLSLKAKGLFYYLMTKPDTWEITREGIRSQLKEGRDAIAGALNELKDCGYLEIRKIRNENGQFETANILHEESTVPENPTPLRETSNGLAVTVNQPQVNTDIVNTESNNTTNVVLDEIKPKEKQNKSNPDINRVISEFESQFDIKLKNTRWQRIHASNLIKRYGVDTVVGGIVAAAASRAEPYAPIITDLKDLWNKWDKLTVFFQRKQREIKPKGVAVITDD